MEKNLWFILMELKMKLLKINFIVTKLYLYLKYYFDMRSKNYFGYN